MYIDTHAHLVKSEYDNLDEIFAKLEENLVINAGVDTKTNKEVIETLKYKNVYGVIGIHPEEVDNIMEEDFLFLEQNINNDKIVGIGEIGLDYHYNQENKQKQKEVFIKQISLAQKYNKPIVIHSRDSINDTYEILKEYGNNLKIVLHCYSGSANMMHKFLKLGVKFGIGGVITFKNAKNLKEVVSNLSLEDILLETDSPYLTPEPHRGSKNSPLNIPLIASEIAKIKGVSVEEVLSITSANAVSLFDL